MRRTKGSNIMAKIRIGLVGAGNIANTHLESYMKNNEAEIAAICDIDEARLKKTADRFGIEKRYTNIDDMLANEKLDAADVCVWNCNHAECTIKALEAGLHVLCEKPMAYSAAEAEEMLATAKRVGKLLMVGFVCRFSNTTTVAKDFIDKGYLGEIYSAKAQYVRRHGAPGGWFCNKELAGGGPGIDIGVHPLDLTRYLMGNPMPVSVFAVTNDKLGKRDYLKTNVGWSPENAKPSDPFTVEDFATALIRYDNGAVVSLEATYSLNGEDSGKRQLFGTKGGLDVSSDTADSLMFYTTINDYIADAKIHTGNLKGGGNYFDKEMAHFVDCCLGRCECKAPAEDGVVVMKILDAIYESAKTGHEVTIK